MSAPGFLGLLAFGLLLGARHALEPDHLIAVSTVASRSRSLWRAGLTGAFWGIGHTLALLTVGLPLVLARGELPAAWSAGLELAVGVVLVSLGVAALAASRQGEVHVHEHVHGGEAHRHYHAHPPGHDHAHVHDASYRRSALVGVLHGMAGSGAVVVLTMSAAGDAWEAVAYIVVFGLGTVVAMLGCTVLIGLPFVATAGRSRLHRLLARATGATSAAYGVYYTCKVAAAYGLLTLWPR